MKSIKTKLVVYFSALILLSSLLTGFFAMKNGTNAIIEEVELGLQVVSHEGAKLTESRIEEQKQILETISGMEDIQSMDWHRQRPILEGQVGRTDFLDMGIVDLTGQASYSDGSRAQLGERDYVKKALNGEANVSDVIVSKVTNEVVLMFAAPIER